MTDVDGPPDPGPGTEPARLVERLEERLAEAWAAHNRSEIVAIRDSTDPSARAESRARAAAAIDDAHLALQAVDAALVGSGPSGSGGGAPGDVGADDARALAAVRETLALLTEDDPSISLPADGGGRDASEPPDRRPAAAVLAAEGLPALLRRMTADYAAAADALRFDERSIDRLSILARLATEQDPAERQRLFLALEPLWRAIDGDGGPTSPYRIALRASAQAWRRDGSPVAANARALGIDPDAVEPWLRAILETWREVAVGRTERVEPWDERFASGAFARALDRPVPLSELQRIDRAAHAALGADPVALGIQYDLQPRPGRGPVPVAFMLDVEIPRRADGGWTAGEQWVFASYPRPRIPDLSELLHETGHAIHARAIRTRPAFAILPERLTTLIEALGDLTAWDLHEPDWQARHLGRSLPLEVGLRARHADVVRDVAWSLFEIELHADPERAPNAVWTAIAERYLGITPHPEWSWWAIRGQLVQAPGYMVNYGLGAIVTADIRARLRELRGHRPDGDPEWYGVVSDAIYRWGAERDAGDLLLSFLGRPVSSDALLTDLRRIAPSAT